jgi:hypothetical protein
MSERPVPEADALEQKLPATAPPAEQDLTAIEEAPLPDAPLPDSMEQSQPAREPLAGDGPVIAAEVPEADAIEQTQPAPLLDEEEEPR